MPNYSMDDEEYWQNPERFRAMIDAANTAVPNARVTCFPMGDPDLDATPVAMMFQMDPGYVVTRHAHACERVEVVVRGSIDDGERILYPGAVMVARPGEVYGPKVAGPDGCLTVEIFSTMEGLYVRLSEAEDGQLVSMNFLEHPELLSRANNIGGYADANQVPGS